MISKITSKRSSNLCSSSKFKNNLEVNWSKVTLNTSHNRTLQSTDRSNTHHRHSLSTKRAQSQINRIRATRVTWQRMVLGCLNSKTTTITIMKMWMITQCHRSNRSTNKEQRNSQESTLKECLISLSKCITAFRIWLNQIRSIKLDFRKYHRIKLMWHSTQSILDRSIKIQSDRDLWIRKLAIIKLFHLIYLTTQMLLW